MAARRVRAMTPCSSEAGMGSCQVSASEVVRVPPVRRAFRPQSPFWQFYNAQMPGAARKGTQSRATSIWVARLVLRADSPSDDAAVRLWADHALLGNWSDSGVAGKSSRQTDPIRCGWRNSRRRRSMVNQERGAAVPEEFLCVVPRPGDGPALRREIGERLG